MKPLLLVFLSIVSSATAATRVERIRNDQVVASEETVRPAETESASTGHSSLAVYLSDGTLESTTTAGQRMIVTVKRGDTVYREPSAGPMRNTGAADVHLVRIEFLGVESAETWGHTGLAPNYRVLLENGRTRVYDIRIPAGTSEPQHTHHDRIVVCLSGAQLKHILPDGHAENSTLKTGEIAWRRGQTHVGQNLGTTNLWVIAVEPK